MRAGAVGDYPAAALAAEIGASVAFGVDVIRLFVRGTVPEMTANRVAVPNPVASETRPLTAGVAKIRLGIRKSGIARLEIFRLSAVGTEEDRLTEIEFLFRLGTFPEMQHERLF